MKKYIIPLSIVAATFAASCSSDENVTQEIDNSMKTPIEFSMTDQTGSATIGAESYRAQTRAGFSAQTRIVMRMMAEKITLGSSSEATVSETKYTKTEAVAETEATGAGYSAVKFNNDNNTINQRYWDDAYGRDTQLSIFAVAVPGKTTSDMLTLKGDNTWGTESDNTIQWTVSTTQTSENISSEDLVYSNNIRENGKKGVRKWDFTNSKYQDFSGDISTLNDGRMKFTMKPVAEGQNQDPKGPGKFDTGNLNFTHALSRITLKIKLAAEFGNNASLDDKEVKVLNMPYKGTLNVATGVFSSIENKDEIVMAPISTTSESDIKGIYMAQVLPGYKIAQNSNNMLQFKVYTGEMNNPTSQNIYYVTNNSVYSAIESNSAISSDKDENNNITMAQGKHYILTITVGKTAIKDITATLVDWTNVEGTHEQNNAYLSFTNAFKNSYTGENNKAADNFDLYRLNDPSTDISTDGKHKGYKWNSKWENKADLTKKTDGNSNIIGWSTKWYFEDNKSFYHFRMVGQKVDGESKTTRQIHTDATNGDYFEIEAGETDGNYTWGAPFVSNSQLKYSTTSGYDNSDDNNHNIHYAIGATNDNIHLTSFHMLSKIRVVLKTDEESKGGVKLQDGNNNNATVKITNVFTKGKVNMGNGLVTAGKNSDATQPTRETAVTMTAPQTFFKNSSSNLETNEFTYFIVPQKLVDNDVYVGLEITTPDNNIYYVVKKLSEIKASSVGDNGTQVKDQPIKWWYPNHSYLYTITLKKTGIENITCTLVDWTEVTGSNQDVTIED